MQLFYRIAGLIGALIWSATIFLRQTVLMETAILASLLGVSPNFGALLLGVGLGMDFLPLVTKRESNEGAFWPLILLSMLLLLISEVLHALILFVPFDVWDMAASVLAALLLALARYAVK